jgi:excisionase family DNA binding protein
MTAEQARRESVLLSMGQARKMLGVSEATLRHWTDEGKIKAFITPGGHRRYLESEVRNFMGAKRRVHGMDDLVAKMEAVPLHEIHIARSHFAQAAWYTGLSDDSKDRLRELGNSLYNLAVDYITRKKKHEEAVEAAREIGHRFGEYLAQIGVSLPDSVEAFLMHRTPLINAANELVKGRESLQGRAAEAIPMLVQITDEVLLSLIQAQQGCANPPEGQDNVDDIDLTAAV